MDRWRQAGTIRLILLILVFRLQTDAHEPVVKSVQKLLKDKQRTYVTGKADCVGKADCWTISVTGHSLGGFIATIVGSTLGINVKD